MSFDPDALIARSIASDHPDYNNSWRPRQVQEVPRSTPQAMRHLI